MASPVPLPDLWAGDEPMLYFELGFTWAELCRLWRMVLAMAVRDGASSVHYHPWRADGHLSFLVAGARYELVPPPPEVARRVAAVAGTLVRSGWLSVLLRRRFGWPLRTAGRVRLLGGSGESEWAGVVWSVGPVIGVEWHRLDSVIARADPVAMAPEPAA